MEGEVCDKMKLTEPGRRELGMSVETLSAGAACKAIYHILNHSRFKKKKKGEPLILNQEAPDVTLD